MSNVYSEIPSEPIRVRGTSWRRRHLVGRNGRNTIPGETPAPGGLATRRKSGRAVAPGRTKRFANRNELETNGHARFVPRHGRAVYDITAIIGFRWRNDLKKGNAAGANIILHDVAATIAV